MSVHDRNKILLAPLPSALSEGEELAIHTALDEVFAPGSGISLGHPSGTMQGPDNLWKHVCAPLLVAMPDLERRDFIVMARPCLGEIRGGNRFGLGANFIATRAWPWLGIQGTRKPVFMRYHESFRIEDTPDRRDRRTPGHPPTHAAGRRLAHGDTACIGAARLFTGERPAASGRQHGDQARLQENRDPRHGIQADQYRQDFRQPVDRRLAARIGPTRATDVQR